MVVYLHPDRYVRPNLRKLIYQARMHLWQTYGASLACVPSIEPWASDWLASVDLTGVLVWNGYGPDSVVDLVRQCQARTRKPAVRLEQGWLPA